jgi:hypothetical protein
MIQLNAAARLTASDDEGIADRAYTEKKIMDGTYRVVEGKGQRWMAAQVPNGRFVVLDMERDGSNLLASGLDRSAAVNAVKIANRTGKWHPTLTMQR